MYDYLDYGSGHDYGITDILSGFDAFIKVIAFILLVIGVIQCLFGYKLIRFTLAVSGFFSGFVLGAAIGFEFVKNANSVSTALGVIAVSGIVGGVIGAYLAYAFYKLGLFLIGFSEVFIVSLIPALLSAIISGSDSIAAIIISAAVPGVIAGFLIVKFTKPLIIIFTAIGGALYASTGLSCIIGGGSAVIFIAMSIAGVYYQCKSNNGLTEKKNNANTHVSNHLEKQNNSAFSYTPITPSKPQPVQVIQEHINDDELPKIDD